MRFFSSLDRRRIATFVVVLVVAFLTGHVMQTVLADTNPLASITDGPDAAPVLRQVEEPQPLPTPPAATLVPIILRPPVLPHRVEEHASLAPLAPGVAAASCDPKLEVRPAPAATMRVLLHAPCARNEIVTVSHGLLNASGTTDGAGRLDLRLPALEIKANVSVSVDGITLEASTEVPDADNFQRVALLWEGPQNLRLNAFEFGARRNELGHVWAGAPKTPTRASRGSGGYLTEITSDSGRSGEIYTYPTGRSPLRGVVRLVVEAEVTAENCGEVVKAEVLQPTAFRRLSRTVVEVALPDCDRIGDVVLLQNLLRDVRLAGR